MSATARADSKQLPPTMSVIVLEAFGSIKNEDLRLDDVSLQTVMETALDRVDSIISLDEVDSIITGMDQEVTYALMDAVEASEHDVEVDPDYFDRDTIEGFGDEDDDFQQKWRLAYNLRNRNLLSDTTSDEEFGSEPVDAVVRVGDAGSNGEELLRQARRKGVPAVDVNIDKQTLDLDAAYGGDEEQAEAEAAA